MGTPNPLARTIILLLLLGLTSTRTTAFDLKGKRALVTGSSGGIGRAIALELASQGCHVLVHYCTRDQLAQATAKQLGTRCDGVLQADFRVPGSLPKLLDQVDAVWPDGFDILVNNAGIVTKVALIDEDDTLSAWHECFTVNLHAPRLLSQLALSRLQKRDQGGVIANVSSIHGEKSNEYVAAYAATKAALESLTRSMAMEWSGYNIRVNAIAPGVVPVERTAKAFDNPKTANAWKDRIPLQRLGTAEQVAKATIPLITNDWVTGSVWQIDGGMMARSNMPPRPRP